MFDAFNHSSGEFELGERLQDRIFVDFFNVYLSLPIMPQKIVYRMTDQVFEFDPPVNQLKYNVDKACLLTWIVDSRFETFKNSVLFHEYQLCVQLIHSAIQEKDELYKDLLCETLGHVAGMRHFFQLLAGTAGEIMYNLWMDLAYYLSIPNLNFYNKWRVFREIQLQYYRVEIVFKSLIDTATYLNGSPYANLWQDIGDLFINNQTLNDNVYNTMLKEQLDTLQESVVCWQQQLISMLGSRWLPRFLHHVNFRRRNLKSEIYDYTICGCGMCKSSVENIEESLILAKDIESTCVGLALTESRPATLRNNRFSPCFNAAMLRRNHTITRQNVNASVSNEEETGEALSANTVKIATTAEMYDGSQDYVLQSNKIGLSHISCDSSYSRIENLFGNTNEDIFLSSNSSCKNSIQGCCSSLRVIDCGQARKRPQWASNVDLSKRKKNRELFRALSVDSVAGSTFAAYLAKCQDFESVLLIELWNDTELILYGNYSSHHTNVGNYLKFWRLKLLTVNMISLSERLGFQVEPIFLALQIDEEGFGQLFFMQDLIAEALYQQWREFCREDLKSFSRSVLRRRHSMLAWNNDDFSETVCGYNGFSDTSSLIGFVKEQKEEFALIKAKERSRKALQFVLRIARIYEGDVMMGFTDSGSFDLTYYCHSTYGSLANPLETASYARHDLIHENSVKNIVSRLMSAIDRRENKRFSLVYRKRSNKSSTGPSPFLLSPNDDLFFELKDTDTNSNHPNQQKPVKPVDFESLVADGVQMDYFRRFMRAMRAIRPLNFYLAVEDMLKCRTYRGRSEKIEYIIRKFFHSTQERTEDALRLGRGRLDGLGLFDGKQVTSLMIEGVQNHVRISLADKWFPMYQDTFIKTEQGELKQVIPTTPRKKKWKRSVARSIESGHICFLENTYFSWKRIVNDLLSFRRCLNQTSLLCAFQKYLAKRRIRSRSSNINAYVSMAASVSENVIATEEPVKDTLNRLFTPDLRKYEDDMYFLIEAEKYTQLWDQWNKLKKQNLPCTHELDQMNRKAKIIIERFIEFQKALNIQVNIPNDIGQTTLRKYYYEKLPERGIFSEIYLNLLPIVYRQWKKYTKEYYMNKYKDMSESETDANWKSNSPDLSTNYLIIEPKFPKEIRYSDDIANVHYGFSVTAGAVLTMPTKLNKQTANASYSAQDIRSKADVADPKLSSVCQPSKSVIAKTASIISHVKESFAHLKNPKVIQGTLAKAKQLSSNGTEVQTMALSHEVIHLPFSTSRSNSIKENKSQPRVKLASEASQLSIVDKNNQEEADEIATPSQVLIVQEFMKLLSGAQETNNIRNSCRASAKLPRESNKHPRESVKLLQGTIKPTNRFSAKLHRESTRATNNRSSARHGQEISGLNASQNHAKWQRSNSKETIRTDLQQLLISPRSNTSKQQPPISPRNNTNKGVASSTIKRITVPTKLPKINKLSLL